MQKYFFLCVYIVFNAHTHTRQYLLSLYICALKYGSYITYDRIDCVNIYAYVYSYIYNYKYLQYI